MQRRWIYIAFALLTMGTGLAFRSLAGNLPHAIRDITGDALWASMVFWWVSAIAPAVRLRYRVGGALLVAGGVEFAQLVRSPTLDSLRATTIGHLVLGSDFDKRDLAAYSLGGLAAGLVETIALRTFGPSAAPTKATD